MDQKINLKFKNKKTKNLIRKSLKKKNNKYFKRLFTKLDTTSNSLNTSTKSTNPCDSQPLIYKTKNIKNDNFVF